MNDLRPRRSPQALSLSEFNLSVPGNREDAKYKIIKNNN